MKAKIVLLALLLIPLGVSAYVTLQFPGWDVLTERSSDILVVHCVSIQDPFSLKKNGHLMDNRGLIDSDFEILSVLKGRTNSGIVRITSEYWPKQGYDYLLFKNFIDGTYESYRVVPIGASFAMRPIAGKPLNDQLQILFRQARGQLNEEIHEDEEQESLLEKAIQK